MTVLLDVAQQSAVFRFMVLLKKEPKEIHEVLVATFNDNALSHAIVKKRAALFKAGRESVGDYSQRGRSTCAVTDERVKDVKKFVVKEGRISIRHIASEISISVESVLKPYFTIDSSCSRLLQERIHVYSFQSRKSCASSFRERS